MRRTFIGLLGLGLSIGLAGASLAQAGPPLVLHHIGPLTGVLAASNAEALQGARLHLAAVNARGGVGGRRIELQALDDGQDPKRSVALFEQLQASGQLLALMLPRTTPSFEALAPLVAKHGVPVIGPQTGGASVNQPPRREVFTLRASYQREAEIAIRHQHGVGVRRFAVLLADDAFGRDVMAGIERTMQALGLPAPPVARIDNRQPDVGPALQALRPQAPQVVLLIASSKASAAFVAGWRAVGDSASFVSLSNTSNIDYVQALGEHARGAIVMQVMPSPFSGGTALARDYAAAATKAGEAMSYAAFYGYASARLATLALGRTAEPTPEKLLQALEGLGDVDLGGLRLRYGAGVRAGSSFVEPTIITHGGRFMR
jgi:branched-chain amino acid transport system substrate-binding protein